MRTPDRQCGPAVCERFLPMVDAPGASREIPRVAGELAPATEEERRMKIRLLLVLRKLRIEISIKIRL
jgi:hypothetical protein